MRTSLADHARRAAVFIAVGASAAVLSLTVFVQATDGFHFGSRQMTQGWDIEPHVSSVLATECGILWAFMGHSLLTFRSLRTRRALGSRFLHFHAVALVGLAVSLAAFTLWYDALGLPKFWSQLLALPVATPFNYLAQRYWTWAAPPGGEGGP